MNVIIFYIAMVTMAKHEMNGLEDVMLRVSAKL